MNAQRLFACDAFQVFRCRIDLALVGQGEVLGFVLLGQHLEGKRARCAAFRNIQFLFARIQRKRQTHHGLPHTVGAHDQHALLLKLNKRRRCAVRTNGNDRDSARYRTRLRQLGRGHERQD